MDYLHPLISKLKDSGVRVHIDDRPKMSPGFKFNEWEMKGVPVRLEVGARDMENGEVFTARRDTGEKFSLSLDAASVKIPELLDEIQSSLFNQALEFRAENTHLVSTWDEFKTIVEKGGFIKCGWDGTAETENKIKAETKATIRCIPFDGDPSELKCIFTGNAAKHQVIFSKAY
jgi:prolyl-tRNA synthetase